jgi:energy-coupling factor transport system ATP-binding protein
VEAEIAFPLENAGWSAQRVALAVEQTAQALGIGDLLARRTADLSGGELQRVVLAASLAAAQRLLVLDEPTSQLDPVAADELLAVLLRLCRDEGRTVVVADHRVERLLEHADRVVVLEDGAVACDATPGEMVEWAATSGREHLLPQLARGFAGAGVAPLPLGLRDARRALVQLQTGTGATVPPALQPAPADRPAAGPAVVALHGVSYAYDESDHAALTDVDLAIGRGERVALMGANGSGKSTLLRLVKGLHEPSAGRIERGGQVELLLQNPNDYLLYETVADEAPPAALARFGLTALAGYDPRDLSGGERQRLALAIVMQADPSLLLLDEPSRGMDRLRRRQLLAEIEEISAGGAAVVLATHDCELAAEFAERVVLLGRGCVLADGSPRELLGDGGHVSTDAARLLPGQGVLTASQLSRHLAHLQSEVKR